MSKLLYLLTNRDTHKVGKLDVFRNTRYYCYFSNILNPARREIHRAHHQTHCPQILSAVSKNIARYNISSSIIRGIDVVSCVANNHQVLRSERES